MLTSLSSLFFLTLMCSGFIYIYTSIYIYILYIYKIRLIFWHIIRDTIALFYFPGSFTKIFWSIIIVFLIPRLFWIYFGSLILYNRFSETIKWKEVISHTHNSVEHRHPNHNENETIVAIRVLGAFGERIFVVKFLSKFPDSCFLWQGKPIIWANAERGQQTAEMFRFLLQRVSGKQPIWKSVTMPQTRLLWMSPDAKIYVELHDFSILIL